MLGNSLAPNIFSTKAPRLPVNGKMPRRAGQATMARRAHSEVSADRGIKDFPERRSSMTQRVSLAATPRLARVKAPASDRVTMIARPICWLAILSYLAVLSVQLFELYAG